MTIFKFIATSSVLALSLVVPSVFAAEAGPHHWDYSAAHGAAKWGEIAGDFKACKDGKAQSPIDISAYKQADLADLEFKYGEVPLTVMNSGNGLEVSVPEGSMMKVGDKILNLSEIHFHTPSEHYVDGVPFPMEAHLVHKAADGSLAVVAVMLKVGRANATVEKIWSHIPAAGESVSPEGVTFSALDLLPANGEYYAYSGSLTSPPCSEGVSWHVMKQPIEVSEEQLRAFQSLFPVNARPVQPLNGRIVEGD